MAGKADGRTRHATGPPARFTDTPAGLRTAIWWAATSMHVTGEPWHVAHDDGWWALPGDGERP